MTRRRAKRAMTTDDLDIGQLLCLSGGASDLDLARLFGSVEAAQEAWDAVRDEFMPHLDHPHPCPGGGDYHAPPGQRPWAWWWWDQGIEKPPTPMAQFRKLERMGVLAKWEKPAALAYMRDEVGARLKGITDARARAEALADVAARLGVSAAQALRWTKEGEGGD